MERFSNKSLDKSPLPPAQTPLNRHSLGSLEEWLNQLGAEQSTNHSCEWNWSLPQWSAKINLEEEELRITWEQNGLRRQCCFAYCLPRCDVEAAML